MLGNDFEHDVSGISEWFVENDILVVDRGYRNTIPLLERIGIDHKMPALLARGEKQLSTEQSNESRLVTKTRWIVESKNGHIKTMFKFFQDTIPTVSYTSKRFLSYCRSNYQQILRSYSYARSYSRKSSRNISEIKRC